MASIQELVEKIQKQSEIDKKKINAMIDEKYEEFSGVINREAAAHLVAQDLGVDIPKSNASKLQIKNIVPGMRNINFIARILKISPINEFSKKNGEPGKVVNVFVSDGTGYTRIPLWNDQVKMVEDEILKIGDTIQVLNGMSKENIYGEVEIAIGKFGAIKKIEDEEVLPNLDFMKKSYLTEASSRVNISELVPGEFEVRGTVVQVFKGNFIFSPESDEKGLVVSCMIDDETGNIRVVFFRELAEKVLGTSTKKLEEVSQDARYDFVRDRLVGKELIISGRVKNNKFFKTLEIVADSVKDLNPLEESKRIADELEAKIGG